MCRRRAFLQPINPCQVIDSANHPTYVLICASIISQGKYMQHSFYFTYKRLQCIKLAKQFTLMNFGIAHWAPWPGQPPSLNGGVEIQRNTRSRKKLPKALALPAFPSLLLATPQATKMGIKRQSTISSRSDQSVAMCIGIIII